MDPKFTFLEKFLEKKLQRKIVKRLIDQELIPSDAVKTNTYSLKFNKLSNTQLTILSEVIYNELYDKSDVSQKSLSPPPQSIQSIPTTFTIPTDFMGLLKSEVFGSRANNPMNFSSTREQL